MPTHVVSYADCLADRPRPDGHTVVLSDHAATLEGLSAATLSKLASGGIHVLAATNGELNLSVAQALAIIRFGAGFYPGNSVTLVDTPENVQALTPVQLDSLAKAHVGAIFVSDILHLSVAQYQAIASVLTEGTLKLVNPAHLVDEPAPIWALTPAEIGRLAAANVIAVYSGNLLKWSQAQFDAARDVGLYADTIELYDTRKTIEALTTEQIDADIGWGVSVFEPIGDGLRLTVDQATHLTASARILFDKPREPYAGTVTVTDISAAISGMTPDLLKRLRGAGLDLIFCTEADVIWSLAQGQAVSVRIYVPLLVLCDTQATLQALSADTYANLSRFPGFSQVRVADTAALPVTMAHAHARAGTSAAYPAGVGGAS